MPKTRPSFEDYWPNILPVVEKLIYEQEISRSQWQNVFDDVYEICLWDETACQKLLYGLKAEFLDLFILEVKSSLELVEDGQQLLKDYHDCWVTFRRHCDGFTRAFQQLDLAIKNSFPNAVRTLLLTLWYRHIVKSLNNRLQNSAREFLMADRKGRTVNSSLFTSLRESYSWLEGLEDCQTYLMQLDKIYVEELEKFYLSRASEYLRENETLQYIVWATSKFDREERRAELYFDSSKTGMEQVIETCKKVLVTNSSEQILSDIAPLLNDPQNLKLIFQFTNKDAGFSEKFLQEYGNFVVTTNLNQIIASSGEKFVENLFIIHQALEEIHESSFNNDPRVRSTLDKAFKVIINDTRIFQAEPQTAKHKCPELLAAYCDLLLRRTAISRKLTSDDITERLDRIIVFINHLRNKDAFIEFYKFHLIRRLLLNTTVHRENDEQFFLKLKQLPDMPLEAVCQVVQMYKDLKISEELKHQFRKSTQDATLCASLNDNNNIVFNEKNDIVDIKILHPRAWRRANDNNIIVCDPIIITDEISSAISNFKLYYNKCYPDRKIDWCHQLSHGTVKFSGNKGTFDLDITAAQLSVLSAFEGDTNESKTLTELQGLTNLKQVELKATLCSLVLNPKLQIQLMKCSPEVNKVADLNNESNSYSINYDFILIRNGKPQTKGSISLISRLRI